MSAERLTSLASAPTTAPLPAKRKLTAEERRRLFVDAKSRVIETHAKMFEALAKL